MATASGENDAKHPHPAATRQDRQQMGVFLSPVSFLQQSVLRKSIARGWQIRRESSDVHVGDRRFSYKLWNWI